MTYGHGFSLIWLLIIAAVVILAIVLIINYTRSTARKGQYEDKESPLNILKIRYARGEISKEEFEEMKQDILKD
ncbi:MAG: SHOCT domain-containing protein [Bacteroidales bacterium]